jgi:hypothetical protein
MCPILICFQHLPSMAVSPHLSYLICYYRVLSCSFSFVAAFQLQLTNFTIFLKYLHTFDGFRTKLKSETPQVDSMFRWLQIDESMYYCSRTRDWPKLVMEIRSKHNFINVPSIVCLNTSVSEKGTCCGTVSLG